MRQPRGLFRSIPSALLSRVRAANRALFTALHSHRAFALSGPRYTAESRYIERLRHTILVVERQPRLGADIPTAAVRGHDVEKQHVARASNDLHRCDALADGLQFGAQVSAELIALCSQTWKLVRRFFAGTAELE